MYWLLEISIFIITGLSLLCAEMKIWLFVCAQTLWIDWILFSIVISFIKVGALDPDIPVKIVNFTEEAVLFVETANNYEPESKLTK